MRQLLLIFICLLIILPTINAEPIKINSENSRYFEDDSGKAIYFTGSHTWWNIQKNPSKEGFEDYLDWMQDHGQNYVRLWTGGSYTYPGPFPWTRPGPGLAYDGNLKFDMDTLNEDYFIILRERVQEVQNRGMYCSVMFFGSFNGFRETDDWKRSAWNPKNNINIELANALNINDGYSFFTTDPATIKIQKKLIRKTIDTLNDLDNFIFEMMNEPDYTNPARVWFIDMLKYVRQYEADKPKQHLIGLVGGWDNPDYNVFLENSPADWWSPQEGSYNGHDYRNGGPATYDKKPVIVDSDHFDGGLYKTNQVDKGIKLVWKTFTRGNHPILMDCHVSPWPGSVYGCSGHINPVFDPIRDAMGDTLNYANKFSDLAQMVPSEKNKDCSTTYCLRNPKVEYLIYQPDSGTFTVDLSQGNYSYEWFNPHTHTIVSIGEVSVNGGSKSFTPPFNGDAIMYLSSIKEPEKKNESEKEPEKPDELGEEPEKKKGSEEEAEKPDIVSCNSSADTNANGRIEFVELMNYILQWQNGQHTILETKEVISLWKYGC